jgi:NADPH2:quinone reductase
MRGAFITRTGPADVIEVGSLPDPVPGPREALVRVRACAVNPIDTYVRAGAVAFALPVPFIVGCDLAGEVVAVGAEVRQTNTGWFAESAVVFRTQRRLMQGAVAIAG